MKSCPRPPQPQRRQATPPVTSIRLEVTPEVEALEQAGRGVQGVAAISTLGFYSGGKSQGNTKDPPLTTPRGSEAFNGGAGVAEAEGKGRGDGVKEGPGAGLVDYDEIAQKAAHVLQDRLRVRAVLCV